MNDLLTAWRRLEDCRLADRREVGGKAATLGALRRAGLPIPAGWVLPGPLLGAWLEGGPPLPADPSARAAALTTWPLPPALDEALVRLARTLGPHLAVRSSALDEDGAERSFAGQHASRIGVSPEEVPAAVRAVWASLYAAGALRYRGRVPDPASMAILIQASVPARAAGVLFTVDPLTGDPRRLVIEAVGGPGEGLVSGARAAQRWTLRRPGTGPLPLRRWLRRWRWAMLEASIEPGQAPLLDEADRRRLVRLALQAEAQLGEALDLEWVLPPGGRPWLVQARPVTTPPPAEVRPPQVLWTRRFLGERWAGPATPLGWSLLEPLFRHYIDFPEVSRRYLGGAPPLRLVDGWPYVNATIFRHLAFRLPGLATPEFLLELLPPEEEANWRRRAVVLPDLSVYQAILRAVWREQRWTRFAFDPRTNPDHWEAFQAALARDLPDFDREPLGPTEALARIGVHLERVRAYLGIHLCSLLFAHLSWQLAEAQLPRWLGPDGEGLARALLVSPPGNETLRLNTELWALAHQLGEEGLAALSASPNPAQAPALQPFLQRFGHRASASWEVGAPRWRDDPRQLFPLLRAALRQPEDPDLRAKRQEEAAEEARRVLERRLVGEPGRLALALVDAARTYLLLRENQRFWFDHLLAALHRLLRWSGRYLVERGALDHPDQVFFLTWPEVQELLTQRGDPEQALGFARRRERDHTLAAASAPPVFLRGDEVSAPPTDASRLPGLAISRGRATGQVRLLRTPADAERLGPGDILVARGVDPGWAPLLATAGGLVLELGSVLSHGAVVAREYQIPAVANVDQVTRRLAEGQHITVDGDLGCVWVHP